ncbi:MAG: trigger factor [Blautia sp.]|nr:trigger factor [Blautia sp.]
MSLQVETLEKNMAKLTIDVAVEDLEKAIQKVYQRMKNRISVPGFRKGKAPRRMVERIYGAEIFLEDAANDLIPEQYSLAIKDCGLDIVSRPKIEIVTLEPGKPMVFTAEVALKPDVELGQYKGFEIPRQEVNVTDEQVDQEIAREQDKNSRKVLVEGRGAEKGDTVTMDFNGTIDGAAFDGGSGNGFPLVLGSNSFIPGFEDQLEGVYAGDEAKVYVTFPEDYHEASLAGKAAVFVCNIKKVETKELPELNDEFAQDVSDFNTFSEYRESVKASLLERQEKAARQALENAAVEKAVENAVMDIPDAMIDTQARNIAEEYAHNLEMQGMNLDQYLQYSGQTIESFVEGMKPNATRRIRTSLVLEKIAQTEGITVTDEELEAEYARIAQESGMEIDKVREYMKGSEDQMRQELSAQKVIQMLADSAV